MHGFNEVSERKIEYVTFRLNPVGHLSTEEIEAYFGQIGEVMDSRRCNDKQWHRITMKKSDVDTILATGALDWNGVVVNVSPVHKRSACVRISPIYHLDDRAICSRMMEYGNIPLVTIDRSSNIATVYMCCESAESAISELNGANCGYRIMTATGVYPFCTLCVSPVDHLSNTLIRDYFGQQGNILNLSRQQEVLYDDELRRH